MVDLSQAGELCGHSFAGYRAQGCHVTLASLRSSELAADELKAAARQWGVDQIALLDEASSDLNAASIKSILADLLLALRPHVVVAHPDLSNAALRAFSLARDTGASAALPAKLYLTAGAESEASTITTAVRAPGRPAQLFVRRLPQPWVTGVLEHDLFAGISRPLAGPTALAA